MPLTMPAVKIVGYILAFLILLSFIQFLLSIFPPKTRSQTTPADFGLDYEDVTFTTNDGIKLAGWWIPGDGNKTVIIGHGYPFDKGNIMRPTRWLHPKYNLLYYDHRSFGQSKGSVTTAGPRETKDVEAAIRFVKKKQKGPIGLYGFSLSAAAMLMANHTGVKAVVSDSTYATMDNMINRVYAIFGPFRFPFVWLTQGYALAFLRINSKDVSPAQSLAKSKVPVLLIHGDKDTQIPVSNAHELYDSSNKNTTQLWIVAGADHGEAMAVERAEYRRRVTVFLEKHLR